MAVKKKKKDKKNRKIIEVNFETSRLTSGLDFRKAQIELYEKASVEEIEDAMNYHGILLHADQIVEDYKAVINVDLLEERYHQKYQNELETLNKKRLVMDEDCVYFFMTKVIEENFDITKLPDPEYIVDHLMKYFKQEHKYDYLIQILRNINNLKDYTPNRNIHELFLLTEFDLEEMLLDVNEDLLNADLTLPQIQKLVQEFREILEYYEFNNPIIFYTDLLELLARHGIEEAKDMFEKGKVLYPKKQINLYNSLLAGLDRYAKEHEEIKPVMKKYYLEAVELEKHSVNDREIFKLIQENFGELGK